MAVRVAVVVALLVAAVTASRSDADVAGTGTFDITASALPTPSFDGSISFDGGTKTVLGQSVNFATGVGDMSYDGDVTPNPAADSATFTLSADADETDFSFDAAGTASCETAGCASGRATFAGRLDVTLDAAGVLPAGAFTFDGTVQIDAQGEGSGVFAINAFPLVPTAAGTAVQVASGPQTFFDSTAAAMRGFTARATFANVTAAGATSFAALSLASGSLPAGTALDPAVSVFVDVQSTAVVSGDVQLCLGYVDADANGVVDGTAIAASQLRLLQAPTPGAPFADVTSGLDAGFVCGAGPASGLLVLAVAQGPLGTTTTTVAPGVGTTTTTSTLTPGESTTTTSVAPGESTTTSTSSTTSTAVGGESTTTSTMPLGETTTTTVAACTMTTTSTCMTAPTTSTSTTSSTVGMGIVPGTTTSTTAAVRISTSTTVPVCATALDCLEAALAEPLCPDEPVNARLGAIVLKKLAKAERAILKAKVVGGAKGGRLLAKARRQLAKIDAKADAFVNKKKGPISSACRDRIRATVGRVSDALASSRI